MHPGLSGKVLVVDDSGAQRMVMTAMLQQSGHDVRAVENGAQALLIAQLGWPDVIVTDLVMPEMDGFELISRLKHNPATAHVPVIVLTAMNDRSARLRGLDCGAEDFLSKPVDEMELRVRVSNLVRLKDYHDQVSEARRGLERQVRHKEEELQAASLETIFTMCRAMEYKDNSTGNHLRRISHYARLIGESMGLEEGFVECLTHATPMHDIGKIGVPDSILCKPGPLDEAEWVIMRSHCELGARLLAGTTSPYLRMGAEIALAHHENFDGSGYPRGLAGAEIPLSARIMTICDRYDALRASRPYKPALSHAESLRIMREGDGRSMPSHLDPDIMDHFLRISGRMAEVFDLHVGME